MFFIQKVVSKNVSEGLSHRPIFSAYRATSDVLFAEIARLYLKKDPVVVDATFGKGNWWKRITRTDIQLIKIDVLTGGDFANTGLQSEIADAFLFDPPFLRSPKSAYGSVDRFRKNYNLESGCALRNHDDILRMYDGAAREASRVLKKRGLMIVKCQDHVSNGEPRLTHVDLVNRYPVHKLRFVDLFILHQIAPPKIPPQNRGQLFARKNHSYFLIFERVIRSRGPRPTKW